MKKKQSKLTLSKRTIASIGTNQSTTNVVGGETFTSCGNCNTANTCACTFDNTCTRCLTGCGTC